MIRFRYARQLTPPAPFVHVTVRCPATKSDVAGLPGQGDTAADRTVLPGSVVEELALVEDGRAQFQGFAGEVIELPIFLVELQVHDFPALPVRAVLGKNEPYILLGRDVLNEHRILLDGPQLVVEIEPPSES
jgi:hypothetical protein